MESSMRCYLKNVCAIHDDTKTYNVTCRGVPSTECMERMLMPD